MTDQTDIAAAVAAQLAALQNKPASSGWAQPSPATPAGVQGVGIPVKMPLGDGNIKITLFFGPEHGASPDALRALLEQLQGLGIPLDVWEPKSSGWNGGGNRGGWNGGGNRGGWNGGGNRRGGW